MTIHRERHLAAEIVVSLAILCIILLLLAVAGPTKDAKAEVCPFGCPTTLDPATYADMYDAPGSIDCGNDLQELADLGYPHAIQVLCQFYHSADNRAEYFRCKMLRERRLRIGKEFSGWVKVDCREYLK